MRRTSLVEGEEDLVVRAVVQAVTLLDMDRRQAKAVARNSRKP
jgi:hypothetical protein